MLKFNNETVRKITCVQAGYKVNMFGQEYDYIKVWFGPVWKTYKFHRIIIKGESVSDNRYIDALTHMQNLNLF